MRLKTVFHAATARGLLLTERDFSVVQPSGRLETVQLVAYQKPHIVVPPPGPLAKRVISRDEKFLSPCNWRYIPLVVKKGSDVFLEDIDGNVYLDFVSGAACNNVGVQNQRVIDAIKAQSDELISMATPGYYYHKIVVDYAEKLCKITPGSFDKKVFFGLSGADATDSAMKMAHRFTGRQRFISFIGCNHGLGTYGATSLSGLSVGLLRGFSPTLSGVTQIPYPYAYRCVFGCDYPDCGRASLRYLEDVLFRTVVPPDEVAAIFVEPIQGDGGVLVPPDDFLPGLQELCRRHGILLVVDEVQTGFGRTGKMFASEYWGLEPDITLLAKPMASGLPVSCVVARSEIAELEKGSLAITAAGHFVGCAAGLATIEEVERRRLAQNAVVVGDYMRARLRKMMESHEMIGEVRGRGLLTGVEIVKDRRSKTPAVKEIAAINRLAFEKGLVTAFDGLNGNVFRIMPSLTLTKKQAGTGLDILEESFLEFESGKIARAPHAKRRLAAE